MFCSFRCINNSNVTKIIVNLQTEERIGIIICDHQARDLSCVDVAMILSNCKIIAQGTPKELVNNTEARNAYFGEALKSIKIKCQGILFELIKKKVLKKVKC